MSTKKAKWIIAVSALAILAAFFMVAASPASAQSGQEEGAGEEEVPPELEEKVEEVKDAAGELRDILRPVVSQFRDLRMDFSETRREGRMRPSLSRPRVRQPRKCPPRDWPPFRWATFRPRPVGHPGSARGTWPRRAVARST